MIRTVVYRASKKPSQSEPDGSPTYGRLESQEGLPPDQLLGRVAKFVPGETLGFALPATLLLTADWAVVSVAVVGLVGTPLWLRKRALREQPSNQQPPKRFYVVAMLAYVAWILAASSPLRGVLGVDEQVAALLVFCAVYLLPLVDDRLDHPPT